MTLPLAMASLLIGSDGLEAGLGGSGDAQTLHFVEQTAGEIRHQIYFSGAVRASPDDRLRPHRRAGRPAAMNVECSLFPIRVSAPLTRSV